MLESLCEAGVILLTILRTPPRSDQSVTSQSQNHNKPKRNIFEQQFGSASGSCPRVQTCAVRTVLVLQSVNEVPLEPGSVGVFTRDHLSLVVFFWCCRRSQRSDPSSCCRPLKLLNKLKRNILFRPRALTEIGAVASLAELDVYLFRGCPKPGKGLN